MHQDKKITFFWTLNIYLEYSQLLLDTSDFKSSYLNFAWDFCLSKMAKIQIFQQKTLFWGLEKPC